MVKRHLENTLDNYLFKGKTVIVYGARQTGITTLIEELIKKLKIKSLIMNGDDADIRELFSDTSASKFRPVIADYKLIVIDEAQRIHDAGLGIKICCLHF